MAADEILGERGPLALDRLRSGGRPWPSNEPLPEFFWHDDARVAPSLEPFSAPLRSIVCPSLSPQLLPWPPRTIQRWSRSLGSTRTGCTVVALAQMLSFAEGMEDVQRTDCYWLAPDQLLSMLWRHMFASGSWGLLDLMLEVAQLDLADGTAPRRREVTAVEVVARAPAATHIRFATRIAPQALKKSPFLAYSMVVASQRRES